MHEILRDDLFLLQDTWNIDQFVAFLILLVKAQGLHRDILLYNDKI